MDTLWTVDWMASDQCYHTCLVKFVLLSYIIWQSFTLTKMNRLLNLRYLLVLLIFISAKDLAAQNPLAAYFGPHDGYPAWTDRIRWDNRINMAAYSNGSTDFEKFENARDQLYAAGGGVLYYPAGTYDFSNIPSNLSDSANGRGLMLKSGVVIMGEEPTTGQSAIQTNGNLALRTKFVFKYNTKQVMAGAGCPDSSVSIPTYGNGGRRYRRTGPIGPGTPTPSSGLVPAMWNLIGITPAAGQQLKEVNHVGILWVELEGAIIYFGPQMTWNQTWSDLSGWEADKVRPSWANRVPDGTHYMDQFVGMNRNSGRFEGAGSGRIVFGCQFVNSAPHNEVIDYSGNFKNPDPNGIQYEFGTYRFGARCAVYGSDVLVANNSMPKPTKCFNHDQWTFGFINGVGSMYKGYAVRTVTYDYAKTHGIDVNKQAVGNAQNRTSLTESPYYLENVIIRDNWVYNHGSKGFEFAGKWVIVKGNRNERDYLADGDNVYNLPYVNLNTFHEYAIPDVNGDNMSRGYDYGGWNAWIDSNYYSNVGSTPGNDGEGIMCQRHGGVEVFSMAITNNSQSVTGKGYMAAYDVHTIGFLQMWNLTKFVGNYKANTMSDVTILENYNVANPSQLLYNANGNGPLMYLTGASANVVDTMLFCSAPTSPVDSLIVTKRPYAVHLRWRDNADNEAGYRIERSINGGPWRTVVIRPRQKTNLLFTYRDLSNGGSINPPTRFNEPEWIDYNLPTSAGGQYRVVTMTCDPNDTSAVSFPSDTVTVTGLAASQVPQIIVYPNPTVGGKFIVQSSSNDILQVELINPLGQIVLPAITNQQNGQISVNTQNLTPGLYRIMIKASNHRVIKSLVISH